MGLRLKQRFAGIKDEHGGIIEEVRGQGLMLGLKCKVPNQSLLQSLAAERMLTVQAGDNVVRLLPPLTVGETEIDEACAKIEVACVALETGARVEA
jgi:acetylornithine/N-succinyldiaminopimelate aminotransferase